VTKVRPIVQMHGVDWETLAKEIPTKEKTQIKNYYQNYKQRLELDQIELPLSAKHPKPNRSRGPGGDASRAATPSRPGMFLVRVKYVPRLLLGTAKCRLMLC